MTGEPEGLQPRADQQVEDAALAQEPVDDSSPTEDSNTTSSPVETPTPEPPAPAVQVPTVAAAFSAAPTLPKPKPADLPPAVEPTRPAAVAPPEPSTETKPIVPPDAGGLPGLPAPDAAVDEVSEEELKAIDEAVYQHLIEEASAGSSQVSEGERRDGTIVTVTEEAAVVDIGGKTEAVIPRSAVQNDEVWAALEAGIPVAVVVVSLGDPGEPVQLEIAREENTEAWDALEAAMADKSTLEGKVVERIKGGLSVEVAGVNVFLPGSQTGLRGGQDLDSMVGETLPVRVVKVSRRRGNAVVSHRELLEEAAAVLRKEALEKISLDAVVEGVVKNVTSYGAFLDLGGVDGLIHVTDLSYGRVKDPSSVMTPGQTVSAKVIKIDEEKGRVSLSLKAMAPDPWETAVGRFEAGAKISGKVASVTDYGAFIELEEGVEGLIHITEMTWSKRLRHPSKILTVGQDIEAVVLKVQQAERRISLSLKQVGPDPWEQAQERYLTGTIVEGRVRNVTSYGAFVELEEGVDGLVHVSDMSWDRSIKDPKHILKKGQPIKAVVLEIDKEANRISLGVKQLQPDAWEAFFDLHAIGEQMPGTVVRLAKFGAFVELAPGVEGLCHSSQIPGHGQSRQGSLLRGRQYSFEIIKVDELDRRIGLRCLSLEATDKPIEAS